MSYRLMNVTALIVLIVAGSLALPLMQNIGRASPSPDQGLFDKGTYEVKLSSASHNTEFIVDPMLIEVGGKAFLRGEPIEQAIGQTRLISLDHVVVMIKREDGIGRKSMPGAAANGVPRD